MYTEEDRLEPFELRLLQLLARLARLDGQRSLYRRRTALLRPDPLRRELPSANRTEDLQIRFPSPRADPSRRSHCEQVEGTGRRGFDVLA